MAKSDERHIEALARLVHAIDASDASDLRADALFIECLEAAAELVVGVSVWPRPSDARALPNACTARTHPCPLCPNGVAVERWFCGSCHESFSTDDQPELRPNASPGCAICGETLAKYKLDRPYGEEVCGAFCAGRQLERLTGDAGIDFDEELAHLRGQASDSGAGALRARIVVLEQALERIAEDGCCGSLGHERIARAALADKATDSVSLAKSGKYT